MLKYQLWYAIIWTFILIIYFFNWSSFNSDLQSGLLFFLVTSIILSLLLSCLSKKVKVQKIIFKKRRKPVITVLIWLLFILDWLYQKRIPIFSEYQGYDPNGDIEVSVGIPGVHVILIVVSVFYAMYLGYIFMSDIHKKQYLFEFLSLLLAFILNNSRGYVIYSLLVFFILFIAFNSDKIKNIKIHNLIIMVFIFFTIIFFISIFGNIRSGYAWNDCSYIQRIGKYDNYPQWLTPHFMWFYTYATTPLANLNLNALYYHSNIDLSNIIYAFLPEQISKSYITNNVNTLYNVEYLNANTGFSSFMCISGILGLFLAFLGIIIYYSIIKFFLHKYVVLETFGNAVLCVMAMIFIFFNPFYASAFCYIPIFLIISSFYLYRKYKMNYILVEEI